jgi:hypothetical protein
MKLFRLVTSGMRTSGSMGVFSHLSPSRDTNKPRHNAHKTFHFVMTDSPVSISSVHSFGSGSRNLPSPISTGIHK